MKKLFVAGCSFSDFTKVRKVYGQYLAEKLGYEYVHEGAGCGSNWRIWRVITNHILNGNLTENDLLIIQYTGFERTEFWSSFDQPEGSLIPPENDHVTIEEYCHGGYITRFKAFSYQWQHSPQEKKFHKMYESFFVNIEFEKERFDVHNHMFQHMLKNYKIKTIFLKTYRHWCDADGVIPEFEPYIFFENDVEFGRTLNLDKFDIAHLSERGHKVYSKMLYDHINKVGLC